MALHHKYILFIPLLIILSFQAHADDGPGAGGGGGGMECPAAGGSSVQLLDFWEAENGLKPFEKPGFKIPRSGRAVETQMKEALARLGKIAPDFAEQIWKSYLYIRDPDSEGKMHKVTLPGLAVESPVDSLESFLCRGGRKVGVGSYSDIEDELDYDDVTLAKMSLTDQAGFWMHEAVYRLFRLSLQESNSIETRILVARLFSGQPFEPIIKPRLKRSFLCERTTQPDGRIFPAARFLLQTDGNITVLVPIWTNLRPALTQGQPDDFDFIKRLFTLHPNQTTVFEWLPIVTLIDGDPDLKNQEEMAIVGNGWTKFTDGSLSKQLMSISAKTPPINLGKFFQGYNYFSPPLFGNSYRDKYHRTLIEFEFVAQPDGTFTTQVDSKSGVFGLYAIAENDHEKDGESVNLTDFRKTATSTSKDQYVSTCRELKWSK